MFYLFSTNNSLNSVYYHDTMIIYFLVCKVLSFNMSKMYQWLSIVTCLLSEDLFFLGKVRFQLFKEGAQGHSLMVQWWGLGTSTDGSWVQTLTGELRSCKSHCAAKKKKEEGRKEHNFRRECSFQFKRIWRMRQKFMKHVRGAFTPNHPRAGSPHPSPHCGP